MNTIKSLFPLFVMVFLLLGACTKEQDIVNVEVELEDPKPGEPVTLLGTVRDTAERVIKNAALRLTLGNIDTETTTDENGFYEIELPASNEKAIIIAAKAEYNRTIQAVELDAREVRKDLYLLADPMVQEANLELNTNALFTFRGRLVDQYGVPIPDVFIVGQSLYGDNNDVDFTGKTDENGRFEFIEEQRNYQMHVIVSSILRLPCFDRFLNFYEHENDMLLDVGDIVFPLSEEKMIQPEVAITDCQDINYVNHIYVPGDFNIIQQQLTSGESFSICDTTLTEAWLYNGVMSDDKQNFNGQYQFVSDFGESQSFSLCTPEGPFVEIRSSEGTTLDLEPDYNNATKTISFQEGSSTIIFSWRGSFGISSGSNRSSFSNMGTFQKTDANQNLIYEMDTDRFYYVNWVTSNSGVLTIGVERVDGSTEFITVRFRF